MVNLYYAIKVKLDEYGELVYIDPKSPPPFSAVYDRGQWWPLSGREIESITG